MEAENEEVSLMQSLTEASTSTENHNHNKIRKRNVPESVSSVNLSTKTDSWTTTDLHDRVPLVILSDSTKAWHDGVTPQISDLTDVATTGKQWNGVLTHEDDHGVTDILTSRERMKISVIRGSIANPDLTLGELRLLGCSSEGFVNGTLPR